MDEDFGGRERGGGVEEGSVLGGGDNLGLLLGIDQLGDEDGHHVFEG